MNPPSSPSGPGFQLPGYELQDVIGEGASSLVYRALRNTRRYAVKVLREGVEGPDAALRFRREASAVACLSHPGLVQVVEAGQQQGTPYVVMRLAEGQGLDRLLSGGKLPDQAVLLLATHLASALAEVHRHGLVHRDIKPANIIVAENGVPCLIDFGFVGTQEDVRQTEMIGTLLYCPPEQSGTLKRPVDGRSDLYALGAVLLEALTGKPPYEGESVALLLQQHATAPVPKVRSRNPLVRPILAAVVEKLLAKDPDDRYQTAKGLLWDLENLDALETDERAGSLRLGKQDLNARSLALESPFVGRTDALAALKDCWARASSGQGSLVLVKGESGSGKTRLIREALRAATDSGALVMTGKSQQADAVPLGPLREAVDGLLHRTRRMEPQARDAELARIRSAAGEFGALVRRLSRSLERVLENAPPLGRSESPEEEQQLFFEKLAEFFLNLANSAPAGAVLHIDDVQWLDPGTLEVLRRMAPRCAGARLLLATTSRDDQDSQAALGHFVREMGTHLKLDLTTTPLTAPEVHALVASHLGKLEIASDIVQIIDRRANGNPFVIGQYVHAMLDSGMLRPSDASWLMDADRFSELALSTDVFKLIVNRIDTLNASTVHVLHYAAVMGMKFDAELLGRAVSGDESRIMTALLEAQRADLIEPINLDEKVYGFVHDRLVEALISSIPGPQQRDIHFALARALDARTERTPQENRTLATHYFGGHPDRAPERVYATSLVAGKAALASFAYADAFMLLERAAAFAQKAAPDASPDLELLEPYAEACTRTGRMDEARALLERALTGTQSREEVARLRYHIAEALFNAGKPIECGKYIADALSALQAPLPSSTLLRRVQLVWFWVLALFLFRTGIGFGSARRGRAAYQTLHKIYELQAPISYVLGDTLTYSLLTMKKMYLAHLLGATPEFGAAHSWYAYLTGGLGLPEPTVTHGEAAIAVGQQLGDRFAEWFAREHYVFGLQQLGSELAFPTETWQREMFPQLMKWSTPWEIAASLCGHVTMHGRRGHSRSVADFALNHWSSAEKGDQHEAARTRSRLMLCLAMSTVHANLHFLGRTQEASLLKQRLNRELGALGVTPWVHAFFYYSEAQALMEQGEFGQQLEDALQGFLQVVYEIHFEEGWIRYGYMVMAEARLERVARLSGVARKRELRQLSRALWMASSRAWTPVERSYLFAIQAGAARERGRLAAAKRWLERAEPEALAADSSASRFLIAREKARIALREGNVGAARVALRSALDMAQSLGWAPRIARLHEELGFLLGESGALPQASEAKWQSSVAKSTFADLSATRYADALLKVSLASASTLDPQEQAKAALDALVRALSAERAFLLLIDAQGELKLQAGRDASGQDLTVLKGYSSTVVKRVQETLKALVVTGTEEGEAIGSESAVAYDLRSIMAAPLSFRDRLLGVVYLDSTLAKGLFTEADVEVLLGIANHIAIALETARSARIEVEQRALAKDIELTAAVQSMFLPSTVSHRAGRFEVKGAYISADQCSGDWWWVQPTAAGVRVFVGDVTGHGAAAAMVTASVATMHWMATRSSEETETPLVLDRMNEGLTTFTRGGFRMTMSALELSENTRQLTWWGAGGPPIMRMDSAGVVTTMTNISSPLGGSDFTHSNVTSPVEVGDRIFIFTDGLMEMELKDGRQLGLKKLRTLLSSTRAMSPDAAREQVINKLHEARKGTPLKDDMTFVLVDVCA